jgi:hypothetical protein
MINIPKGKVAVILLGSQRSGLIKAEYWRLPQHQHQP